MIKTLKRELRRLQGSVLDFTRHCCELDSEELRSLQSNIMRVYLHITSKSNQYTFECNLNQINNTIIVLVLFCILFLILILKVDYMLKIVFDIL